MILCFLAGNVVVINLGAGIACYGLFEFTRIYSYLKKCVSPGQHRVTFHGIFKYNILRRPVYTISIVHTISFSLHDGFLLIRKQHKHGVHIKSFSLHPRFLG